MPAPGLPDHDPKFDGLLVQVHPDNVLAAHAVLRRQADDLELALTDAQYATQVGRCGGDPISLDAQGAFNAKITDVLDVHWRHQQELDEAADLLHRTALGYGHTENDLSRALDALDHR